MTKLKCPKCKKVSNFFLTYIVQRARRADVVYNEKTKQFDTENEEDDDQSSVDGEVICGEAFCYECGGCVNLTDVIVIKSKK